MVVTSSSARRCPGGSSGSWAVCLAVLYGPEYLAGRFGLPASSGGAGDGRRLRLDVLGDHRASISSPGAVAGGAIGWLIIRPVNAVLGWLFRGFNRLFDVVTHGYSWTVGKLLRISVVVLLVYGGLVAESYRVFQQAPTGFIPQQDQGRLIVDVQLPDSASLQRTQDAMALVDKITRETPGVAHAVGHRGNVVSAPVQRLQFRLDVHRPRAVRRAEAPRMARRHDGVAQADSRGHVRQAEAPRRV